MIYGDRDPIPKSASLTTFVPNAEEISLDCGHWIQEEKPEETTQCDPQLAQPVDVPLAPVENTTFNSTRSMTPNRQQPDPATPHLSVFVASLSPTPLDNVSSEHRRLRPR